MTGANHSFEPKLEYCVKRLEEIGAKKAFSKNQTIVEAGEKCVCCYLILDGQVIGFDYTECGAEHHYILHDGGQMLLENILLGDKPVPVGFQAVRSTELVAIDKKSLLAAMAEDFEINKFIVNSISLKLEWAMRQIHDIAVRNTSWRICDLFLVFAEKYGKEYDGKVMIEMKMSQQMIGNLLRINRITVVRCLNELKATGLIDVTNQHYCVRNIEKLKTYKETLVKG
jgi:CRP-like cAMP-binding protein